MDDYQVTQQTNRIDVLPNQVRGANDAFHPVTPVMSHPISFPKLQRSVAQTLMLITSQISQASGKKVTLLWEPFNERDQVEIGADAELPGDLLARLASTIGTVLSYQCMYDDGDYYLSLIPVTATVIGNLVNNPTPGPQPPTPMHFYTKDLLK